MSYSDKKLQRLVLFITLAATALSVVACKPRASRTSARNRTNTKAAAATPAATGTPSVKSVLTHADSALARVAQISESDRDTPPYAEPAYPLPRTSYGAPYVPMPNLSEYASYEAALGAYNAHRYEDAISLFSTVVASGRPPELIPNAYYWMGEAYYAMGRYSESMPYFEYVTRVGPQYKREMSLYKLSRANMRLGNVQAQNMWYERLRNENPKSSLARTLAKLGAR